MLRLWQAIVVELVFLLGMLAVAAPGGELAFAASGPSLAALRAAGRAQVQDVYIRPPRDGQAPTRVVVVLHGMGSRGADFAAGLAAQADTYGWLLVAPTIAYGDWTDPNAIAYEDPALVAWLSDYVAHLSGRTGFVVGPRVLLFGHSRGAQLALRFTEIHPEQVAGVAAVSAGTYTLPLSESAESGEPLNFPFGVADLARADGGQAFNMARFYAVPVWIGVGGKDDNAADVPSAWTPYLGRDRLQRARTFTNVLSYLGADVTLSVFPDADHTLTDDMRVSACTALARTAA